MSSAGGRNPTISSGIVSETSSAPPVSRYESQKRRDWITFGHYLRNHKPPLCLSHCSGAHVLEFLRYLDQFGKTKVHTRNCPFFGHPHPPGPCPCPLNQAWGSLDALIGRLRAAFEENGGRPETNPFGTRAVRLYLREVRDSQARARGIAYEKKKRKTNTTKPAAVIKMTHNNNRQAIQATDYAAAAAAAAAAGGGSGSMMSMEMLTSWQELMNKEGHFHYHLAPVGQFYHYQPPSTNSS